MNNQTIKTEGPSMTKEDVELTPKQVSGLIGKHYFTTLNYMKDNKIKSIQRGAGYFTTRSEVARFLREGNYKGEEEGSNGE